MGANHDGELGDNTMTARDNAVHVVALGGNNVAAVAGGGDTGATRADLSVRPPSGASSFVLKADGTAFAFGCGGSNALLCGGEQPVLAPVLIENIPVEGVRMLACGLYHTMALTNTGEVMTWGVGARGQLGHGLLSDEPTPRVVRAQRVGPTVHGWRRSWIESIAAGGLHSAALTMEGRLYTWGAGTYFQIGDGSSADRSAPVEVTSVGRDNMAVELGRFHSVLLSSESQATHRCTLRNATCTPSGDC
jgi:alpha-tubulin suppressor-like RCC1 family protein